MRMSIIIKFRTPKLGGVGTRSALPGSRGEKTHFQHLLGGGWTSRNSVGLDPEKRILGCPSALLMIIRFIIEFSTLKLGGEGT